MLFAGKPCQSLSVAKAFHAQFVLDLFFFFKQFQSHCIYQVFPMQKSKSSTSLNLKEGKQEEQLSIKVLRFLILGKKVSRV